MIDCISVENMRLSDAQTIATLVPSLELMYRAAYGVFLAAKWQGSAAIVVGSGNNGGDGFALASILREHDIDCCVFTLSQRLSQDSAYYAKKAEAAGIPIRPFQDECLNGFDIVVDCLLGTGFQGSLRDPYKTAIAAINTSGAYVVSVDINSGMNGDTGEAELAVRSDLTVTIGYIKTGLLTENAGSHMKRLVCTDIGIVLAREEGKICSYQEWESLSEEDWMRYYLCPPWLDMTPIRTYS